jgi:uncharacterized protein YigA (DUF484 family)
MNEQVRRLREHRRRIWHEAKALADVAAAENRNFDSAEQDHWEALNAELNSADERLKGLDSSERRAVAAQAEMARLAGDRLAPRHSDIEAQFRDRITRTRRSRSRCAAPPVGARAADAGHDDGRRVGTDVVLRLDRPAHDRLVGGVVGGRHGRHHRGRREPEGASLDGRVGPVRVTDQLTPP